MKKREEGKRTAHRIVGKVGHDVTKSVAISCNESQ